MLTKLIFLALGGASGALMRFGVTHYIQKTVGLSFPFGTLIVNVIGSFLLGFFFQLFLHQAGKEHIKLFIMTGLLGAFTTFSTFSVETLTLFKDEAWPEAIMNIFLNNALSLFGAFLGFLCGQFFSGVFLTKQ